MERNQIIAIVVIVVIVGGVGAYFLLVPPPPTGQTYVHETIGNPDYMDPHNNYESFGAGIAGNVYETLYTIEFDSLRTDPVVPLLATDLVISANGLKYTFTLRQGVTFHDGTPFNASCVQYNFERMLGTFDPSGPVWMVAEPIVGGAAIEGAVYGENLTLHEELWEQWVADNAAGTGAVNVIDDYTVEINLAYAFAPFLASISWAVGSMISPTWVESLGGIEVGSHNDVMDEEMVGTGPYMLTEWVVDERIVLTRNENYWREEAAKAQFPFSGALDEVIIKTNEDVNSRILNLQAGEADSVYIPATHGLQFYNNVTPPTFATNDGTQQSLEPDKYKVWAKYPTFTIAEIHFTMSDTMNETTLGRVVENPYRLKNVRKALSYSMDYDTAISQVLNGFGIASAGPVPSGMFGHDDNAFRYTYDLDEAVTYWNDAMNNDGLDAILANNSYRLIFYYNSGNEARRLGQLLLKDGLTAMLDRPDAIQPSEELTIDVQGVEWSTYIHAAIAGEVGCWMIGWLPDYADADNYVVAYVKSTGTYSYWARLEDSAGWDAATVDGWIDDAAKSTDEAERLALYEDVQTAIIEHAAYIWMWQTAPIFVCAPNVFNYQYVANPMLGMTYWYSVYKTE
jgi:peptide/nickel transport system substrate-binding protein